MLTNKIWIFGEDLLNRWRWMPFQLTEAWNAGLPAYRPHDGEVQKPGGCLECCRATPDGFEGADCRYQCSDDALDVGTTGERLRALLFDFSEVQAFEQAHGLTIWTPAAQEQGADPGQVETPAAFVARLRAGGVHDHHELVLRVDREFTGPRYLSDLEVGRLLPADPTRTITDTGARDRGKRLRGKKK